MAVFLEEKNMIKLHRLNGEPVIINAELIETVESVPDTKIVLISNNQFIVKESPDEVADKILEYRIKISSKNSKEE